MNSIEEYLRICRDEKRLAPKTIKQYERELEFLSQLNDAESIQSHLAKLASATVIRKLVIWRSFAKAMQSDLLPFLTSVKLPTLKQREPNFLTENQVVKVRSQIHTLSLIEQLFFELGLSMGLRLAEILGLTREDFDGNLVRVKRKGGNIQRLPISDEVESVLARIGELPEKIFPFNPVYYWALVREVGRKARLNKLISPHCLRHTFATHQAANGTSLHSIKAFLGHAKITTTERYLHVIPEYLRGMVQKGNKYGTEK